MKALIIVALAGIASMQVKACDVQGKAVSIDPLTYMLLTYCNPEPHRFGIQFKYPMKPSEEGPILLCQHEKSIALMFAYHAAIVFEERYDGLGLGVHIDEVFNGLFGNAFINNECRYGFD